MALTLWHVLQISLSILSEIAFRLELALGKAESMTESNDAIYETNFETGIQGQ
jgi:hypothetical protein